GNADFAFLILARLLIPPPWPVDFDCKFATCDCKDGEKRTGYQPVACGRHGTRTTSLCFHDSRRTECLAPDFSWPRLARLRATVVFASLECRLWQDDDRF